jgi:hypothetical protein
MRDVVDKFGEAPRPGGYYGDEDEERDGETEDTICLGRYC